MSGWTLTPLRRSVLEELESFPWPLASAGDLTSDHHERKRKANALIGLERGGLVERGGYPSGPVQFRITEEGRSILAA